MSYPFWKVEPVDHEGEGGVYSAPSYVGAAAQFAKETKTAWDEVKVVQSDIYGTPVPGAEEHTALTVEVHGYSARADLDDYSIEEVS